MANQIALTVGATTVVVPIKLGNQQLVAFIRRYALEKGVDVGNLTAEQVGVAALKAMLRDAREVSSAAQIKGMQRAYRQEIVDIVAAENDLFDDEELAP